MKRESIARAAVPGDRRGARPLASRDSICRSCSAGLRANSPPSSRDSSPNASSHAVASSRILCRNRSCWAACVGGARGDVDVDVDVDSRPAGRVRDGPPADPRGCAIGQT